MKKLPIILVCLLAVCSCSEKQEQQPKNVSLGKYLFIGDNGVIHKDENCHALKFGRDENGHRAYGKIYADTAEFIYDPALSFCTRCIDKTDYERITAISRSNINKQNIKKPNPMN